MERRSFLKAGGVLGLAAATPALAAELAKPKPKADVFSRGDNLRVSLPSPEDAVHRWYTQDTEIAHTFDLQIAFHQIAEAEMKRLPAWQELPEPDVRRMLNGDPSCRVQRTVTPRFVLDIYDNGTRELAEPKAYAVPLGTASPNLYIGGHSVPHRILRTAREAVADLVRELLVTNPRAAFTCPRAVIDFKGFMLEFFFYSQRVYHVPPPAQMPHGTVTHTTIYPEKR